MVNPGLESEKFSKKRYYTPTALFIITLTLIFVAEVLVMFILSFLPPISVGVETFVDAFLLSIIGTPILYFFVFRPMVLYFNENKWAEEKIREIVRCTDENPNPVLRITRDKKIIYINEAGKIFLSGFKNEINGHIPEDFNMLVDDALKSDLNRKVDVEQNGLIFSITIIPISDSDYVNIYGEDITVRNNAKEELIKTINELNRFNKLAVGRELRMIELKKEVNELLHLSGGEEKYRIDMPNKETIQEKDSGLISCNKDQKSQGF
jgi:hypothetical protein